MGRRWTKGRRYDARFKSCPATSSIITQSINCPADRQKDIDCLSGASDICETRIYGSDSLKTEDFVSQCWPAIDREAATLATSHVGCRHSREALRALCLLGGSRFCYRRLLHVHSKGAGRARSVLHRGSRRPDGKSDAEMPFHGRGRSRPWRCGEAGRSPYRRRPGGPLRNRLVPLRGGTEDSSYLAQRAVGDVRLRHSCQPARHIREGALPT